MQAPAWFRDLRVLVVHDWVVAWAGAERVLEQILTVFPSADLVVGLLGNGLRSLNDTTACAKETWLSRLPFARARHRWFVALEGIAFASLPTDAYDLVISSSHAFSKAVRRPPNGLHVCYCHSPPRYLWDLYSQHMAAASAPQQVALRLGALPLRHFDRWAARHVDHFVANSRFVAERISRTYGRNATVVYPPVACRPPSQPAPNRGEFLLSLGRLVPYKRVDLAIAAAARIGRELIVAGDGPDRARLERMARNTTTTFVGAVSEAEASRLFEACAAFLFCAEEDFGIAPVEANAHGAPVVGFSRGGLAETMVPGETAEFFHLQTVDGVVLALEKALSRAWDPAVARANAARFAPERFRSELARTIEEAFEARRPAPSPSATWIRDPP